MLKPRARKVKILATLGPASSDPDMIRALVEAGADAFRINMSHGSQAEKAKLVEAIRGLEKSLHRPMTIVFDLQGPKLRVGKFKGGSAQLTPGHMFVLDREHEPGDATRVELPHPELFEALSKDAQLLIDDGKIRLRVAAVEKDKIATVVEVGGKVSNNKGVNVPGVLIPIPALTDKDRKDLVFALEQGADYVALSFVQRPEDVAEARALVDDKAALMAKIEKPQAIDRLDEILELADAVMSRAGTWASSCPPKGCRRCRTGSSRRPARRASRCGGDADAGIDDRFADPDPGRSQRRRQRHL
jgi:pyruvate kinase